MTDKEILDVVYEVLKASQEADMGVDTDQIVKEQISFIKEERQRREQNVSLATKILKRLKKFKNDEQLSPPPTKKVMEKDWFKKLFNFFLTKR